jgi:hypothetical protein
MLMAAPKGRYLLDEHLFSTGFSTFCMAKGDNAVENG